MDALPTVNELGPARRRVGVSLPLAAARVGAFGESAASSEALLSLTLEPIRRTP